MPRASTPEQVVLDVRGAVAPTPVPRTPARRAAAGWRRALIVSSRKSVEGDRFKKIACPRSCDRNPVRPTRPGRGDRRSRGRLGGKVEGHERRSIHVDQVSYGDLSLRPRVEAYDEWYTTVAVLREWMPRVNGYRGSTSRSSRPGDVVGVVEALTSIQVRNRRSLGPNRGRFSGPDQPRPPAPAERRLGDGRFCEGWHPRPREALSSAVSRRACERRQGGSLSVVAIKERPCALYHVP